jgi:hypothetical protein
MRSPLLTYASTAFFQDRWEQFILNYTVNRLSLYKISEPPAATLLINCIYRNHFLPVSNWCDSPFKGSKMVHICNLWKIRWKVLAIFENDKYFPEGCQYPLVMCQRVLNLRGVLYNLKTGDRRGLPRKEGTTYKQ